MAPPSVPGRVPGTGGTASVMRRLPILSLLAVTAVVPASAAVGRSAHTAATKTVILKNISIHPATVRIHAGDSVRWEFKDRPTPHNVTSSGKPRFHSSATRQTGTYIVRFAKAGTYRYHCTIHPNMQGRVVVS